MKANLIERFVLCKSARAKNSVNELLEQTKEYFTGERFVNALKSEVPAFRIRLDATVHS